MNLHYLLLAFTILLTSCQSTPRNRIQVQIPSAETEAAYIWSTIQDIPFFEAHNYQVSLPKGDLIDQLIEKSKSENLEQADYESLELFIKDSVYTEIAYQKGYDRIQQEVALLNTLIDQIEAANFKWGFKNFESYRVNLTLYGPGGSYNPDEGSLLIYTTPDGRFKNYENPANTIIHEIVHIGIEASIISRYNVPHTLKERIVDAFVFLHFGRYLPQYKVQDMGDLRLDDFVKKRSDFDQLDEIVENILNEDNAK